MKNRITTRLNSDLSSLLRIIYRKYTDAVAVAFLITRYRRIVLVINLISPSCPTSVVHVVQLIINFSTNTFFFSRQISIFDESTKGAEKEDLQKMNYLERVIKESMRLYTVVPIIARKIDKDIYLRMYFVNKLFHWQQMSYATYTFTIVINNRN